MQRKSRLQDNPRSETMLKPRPQRSCLRCFDRGFGGPEKRRELRCTERVSGT